MVAGDAHRATELENFHGILADISWGMASERVRQFIVDAYVRGAPYGNAERSELEGSTAVFTKRLARTVREGLSDWEGGKAEQAGLDGKVGEEAIRPGQASAT